MFLAVSFTFSIKLASMTFHRSIDKGSTNVEID